MKPSTPTASSAMPRYDLGLNPPYQINYRAKRAGKHISASKRRITFQFGFSSAAAINAGRTEVECRGEEHEVVLVWSHLTGKRQLFMDGREIHMSKAARGNTKFEYSWSIPGGHIVKILANGTPSQQSYYKQFDLELDGMSFFEFANIYELGKAGVKSRGAPEVSYSYRGAAYDARDDNEELEDEAQPPMPEVKVGGSVDLFDIQPSSTLSPMTQYSNQFSSVPSLVGSTTSSTSTASYDEFTPVENIKTYDALSSQILGAYSDSNVTAPTPQDFQDFTPAPSSSRALVPLSEDVDVITKSMRNLVNLDDINTGPLQPIKAPNSPISKQKQQEISWALVGRTPTLSEMRDNAAQSPGSPREVMKQAPQPVQQQYYQGQPQQMVAYQSATGAPQHYGYYGAPAMPSMGYTPAY